MQKRTGLKLLCPPRPLTGLRLISEPQMSCILRNACAHTPSQRDMLTRQLSKCLFENIFSLWRALNSAQTVRCNSFRAWTISGCHSSAHIDINTADGRFGATYCPSCLSGILPNYTAPHLTRRIQCNCTTHPPAVWLPSASAGKSCTVALTCSFRNVTWTLFLTWCGANALPVITRSCVFLFALASPSIA
jgi:hypothetical protein